MKEVNIGSIVIVNLRPKSETGQWLIEAIILNKSNTAIKYKYWHHENREEWMTAEQAEIVDVIGETKKNMFGKFKKIYY